ncbi:unnamed protein product, partial [marine sediment metagenome]
MPGKKLSPADKTQVRITKDKRELKRLVKEAQKRLIEGHSPVVYDYVNPRLWNAAEELSGADDLISNYLAKVDYDVR